MPVTALERSGNSLRFIDQTKLPTSLEYRKLDGYLAIIEAIKALEIRGAPAIGIAAAYALAVAVTAHGRFDDEFIIQIAGEIKSARPTAVNLCWAVDRVLKAFAKEAPTSLSQASEILWSQAELIHEEDRQRCLRIGINGATLINESDTILTHCNTGALATGGIGTALGIIFTCHQQGKTNKVYVDETRPLLQGARLTAWELMQEGISATLVCDSTAGFLMSQGKIDVVIVGADRIAANGDTANKIGTYSLAVLARAHNIPFYVAAPSSTFDNTIESGDEIVIEERSGKEVTEGFGKITAPDGIEVYSPAFDVTPGELITAHITEEKIIKQGRR